MSAFWPRTSARSSIGSRSGSVGGSGGGAGSARPASTSTASPSESTPSTATPGTSAASRARLRGSTSRERQMPAGALGDRQRAADRAHVAGQRELADDRAVGDAPRRSSCSEATRMADRHRQVEPRADLAQVGGREVDGDALLRELVARVRDRRPHALARLADRLVRQPDDREGRQAAADVGLDPHAPRRRRRRSRTW